MLPTVSLDKSEFSATSVGQSNAVYVSGYSLSNRVKEGEHLLIHALELRLGHTRNCGIGN